MLIIYLLSTFVHATASQHSEALATTSGKHLEQSEASAASSGKHLEDSDATISKHSVEPVANLAALNIRAKKKEAFL